VLGGAIWEERKDEEEAAAGLLGFVMKSRLSSSGWRLAGWAGLGNTTCQPALPRPMFPDETGPGRRAMPEKI
jgi:hypothetical protein